MDGWQKRYRSRYQRHEGIGETLYSWMQGGTGARISFYSIAASDFFRTIAAGTMGDRMGTWLSHIWQLLRENWKVQLAALLSCLGVLWALEQEVTGVPRTGVKVFMIVSACSLGVTLLAHLLETASRWKIARDERRVEERKLEEKERFAYGSVQHLRPVEKYVLRDILERADGDGLFRRTWTTENAPVVKFIETLRERQILYPSSPSRHGSYATGYVEFWQLSPAILKRREEILTSIKPQEAVE